MIMFNEFIHRFIVMKFHFRLFLLLSFGFISFTIVGTLSHETGHWLAMEYFGEKARIGYGYTVPTQLNVNDQRLMDYYRLHKEEFERKKTYKVSEEIEIRKRQSHAEHLIISICGPLQTILTSLVAFIFILLNRNSFLSKNQLGIGQWVLVFLSLFSLRQVANLVSLTFAYIFNGKLSFRGDEIGIAYMLNWPILSIQISTAILGLLILLYIVFAIIPLGQRFTFLLSGIFGGVMGFLIWLVWAGPIILP